MALQSHTPAPRKTCAQHAREVSLEEWISLFVQLSVYSMTFALREYIWPFAAMCPEGSTYIVNDMCEGPNRTIISTLNNSTGMRWIPMPSMIIVPIVLWAIFVFICIHAKYQALKARTRS